MKLFRKLFWSEKKPDYPCVFLCRTNSLSKEYKYDYVIYRLEYVNAFDSDGKYLGLLAEDGEEIGSIVEDFPEGEYKIIEWEKDESE